jgi:hypothetical protein
MQQVVADMAVTRFTLRLSYTNPRISFVLKWGRERERQVRWYACAKAWQIPSRYWCGWVGGAPTVFEVNVCWSCALKILSACCDVPEIEWWITVAYLNCFRRHLTRELTVRLTCSQNVSPTDVFTCDVINQLVLCGTWQKILERWLCVIRINSDVIPFLV